MKVYALITARAGSKGVPSKNTRQLGSKPLLLWTIEAARQSSGINRILLSTEEDSIAQIGRNAGIEVPFLRPAELARDGSSHVEVVLHALAWLKNHEDQSPDYILLLQPTSPFRTADDIDNAIMLAKQTPNAPAVISVSECGHFHPYYALKLRDDGTLQYCVPSDFSERRRQEVPMAYAANGAIYLNRVDAFLNKPTFIPTGTLPYVMPAERSIDIDTSWDLHIAELLVRKPYEAGND
jgi:CMP-N,N'-diacetyllegionaminic acid synthase